MGFPRFISFTVTNACNLRCRMCGQWSEKGYVRNRTTKAGEQMEIADWKRLVDEISEHEIRFILIRGGEPFLFPGIIELIEHIHSKGIFVSIDTNGTLLEKYAADLVRTGILHITFSVDGPEEIHDEVRGVKGSFQKTKDNILLLKALEEESGHPISKSICFTISRYSYKGLGAMPDVARSMGIGSINIVPYYYVPAGIGTQYEEELRTHFSCFAYSWRGFQQDDSGIDFSIFQQEYGKYLAGLDGIENFPYMPFSEKDYLTWFRDAATPVGSEKCMNVEDLIDIQPNGGANFCVDYPDYFFGNVKNSAIQTIWNSPAASEFRKYRREKPLAICRRCGAKYISEIRE